jgi:DNA-binding protein H-NS
MSKIFEKISAELDQLSSAELAELADLAERKIREKKSAERDSVLKQAQELVRQHGFSLEELIGSAKGRKPRKDAGQPVAPKYRSPDGKTWSGRGREPTWIREAEAKGQSRDRFRIAD